MIEFARVTALFACAAVAEILGCYLPWLVLKQGKSAWLLVPAAVSLAAFVWLLTLPALFVPAFLAPGSTAPTNAAGRTYAAYGGMYVAIALLWLRWVIGVPLTRWDVIGAAVALAGMAIIAAQPQGDG